MFAGSSSLNDEIMEGVMLSATVQELTAPTNAALKALWCTLAGTALFFVFFAWVIIAYGPQDMVQFFQGVPLILAIAVGTVAASLSILLGLYFHSEAGLRSLLQSTPSTVELSRDPYGRLNIKSMRQLQRLDLGELRLVALRTPYFRILMIRLVLAELVAVAGLVVAIGSGQGALTIPFSAAALVVMLFAWPRLTDLLIRGQLLLVDGELLPEAC